MCFKTTRQVVDIRPNFPPQGLHNQCFILVLLNERYHTAKNLQVSRRSSEQACWNLCQTLMGDQKENFHSHDVNITSSSEQRQNLTGQRTHGHLPKSMLRQLHCSGSVAASVKELRICVLLRASPFRDSLSLADAQGTTSKVVEPQRGHISSYLV